MTTKTTTTKEQRLWGSLTYSIAIICNNKVAHLFSETKGKKFAINRAKALVKEYKAQGYCVYPS